MKNALLKLLVPLLLAGTAPGPSFAADPPLRSVNDVATYRGADRDARLVEAAKKEGEVSIYHVYPNLPIVLNAFTKKYGIKVKAWRAGSEAVLQRVVAEARGNRFEVDVVQNNAPENEATHREKLLQTVWSPYQQDLIPQAVPAHREWAGITLDVWTAAYNTNAIRKEELPKSYKELADPKWKGKLGIEGGNFGWFGTLLDEIGDKDGLKLFENIVATNGISVRKGHSLLTTMVSSGEVPLALTVYSWNPEQLKKKGAPIEALLLPPLIAQPSTIGVLKKAPHPNAAVLLYDFMLNEGQALLAADSYVPTSRKVESPVATATLKFVDPARALDMQDKWLKSFDETIVRKAR